METLTITLILISLIVVAVVICLTICFVTHRKNDIKRCKEEFHNLMRMGESKFEMKKEELNKVERKHYELERVISDNSRSLENLRHVIYNDLGIIRDEIKKMSVK